jgi:hypothetical protein
MTGMTGSPDDFTRKIDVLEVTSAGTPAGMLTLVLGEQLCCISCGHVSTRWQVPAAEPVAGQQPCGNGSPDPGE